METKYTPEKINVLEPNEVFVFGSNLQGRHLGGAARVAWEKCADPPPPFFDFPRSSRGCPRVCPMVLFGRERPHALGRACLRIRVFRHGIPICLCCDLPVRSLVFLPRFLAKEKAKIKIGAPSFS